MSSIEIIEEYRALWAQAQQELQMTQILVAAMARASQSEGDVEMYVSRELMQDVAESCTLDLDSDGDMIVVRLKENEDA